MTPEQKEKRARGRRVFRAQQDQKHGYSINKKRLVGAYLIEAAIIGSAAYAGWEFANRYAGDGAHQDAWRMAIVATVAICFAELARVPLAQACCTQPTRWRRALAIIGVLMMCLVTTKSMAQVMEQMFHPRLRQVQTSSDELHVVQAGRDKLVAQRGGASAKSDALAADVKALDKQIEDARTSLHDAGAPPPQRRIARRVPKRDKRGRVIGFASAVSFVDVPWAGKLVVDQINDLTQKRADAAAKAVAQLQVVTGFEEQIAASEQGVTAKNNLKREAVANSQLHSFTAMVFGKDPVEVTDGEVHWFLRFFVLLPALMIAGASTLLAVSAFTPVKRKPEDEVNASLDIMRDGTLAAHINSNITSILQNRKTA